MGYPPGDRVPPRPRLDRDLPPPRPRLDQVPPLQGWIGTPPDVNRLKLLPSPILRMAGGNYLMWR